MQPKIIFIDWDQTLNHMRFWGHWRDTRPEDYEAIQQTLFSPANKPMIHAWMRGQRSAEDVVEWLARQSNWSASKLLTELQTSCELETFTDQKAAELIAELRRRGHLVVIATDNMDTFTRWTVPATRLTDHVDGILNSYGLGVLKCDHGNLSWPFFDQFLADRAVGYQDCVLIDDSEKIEIVAQQFDLPYRQVNDRQALVDHLHQLTV